MDLPGPAMISQGIVPDGAVMRFYDDGGRLVLERILRTDGTDGTDWTRGPAEACAAVDQGLAELSVVVYDGDTGARLPMTFGMVCQLRPRP